MPIALTFRQAATELSVNIGTLRRLVAEGKIAASWAIGPRSPRITPEALRAFLAGEVREEEMREPLQIVPAADGGFTYVTGKIGRQRGRTKQSA